MYKNQRHRGTEGFGFYVPGKNKLVHNTDEQAMLKKLKSVKATEMLFHHRFPTSTANVFNACHPFRVVIDGKDYIVVHNGYLSNEHELKIKHEKQGYKYSSVQPDGRFNDSEALAYDLALYLSGKQRKLYSQGAIAFIVYTQDALYFGRNTDSPLQYHINDKFITIRSEGKGNTAIPNTLYKLKNGKLTQRKLTIPGYYYTGYTTYTSTYTGSWWKDEQYDDTDNYNYGTDSMTLVRDELQNARNRLRIAIHSNDAINAENERWYIGELEDELEFLKQI
jgi:glucosamine 6-phosphate synthetase-like amidotransferase/phosphosugar isomerase protein